MFPFRFDNSMIDNQCFEGLFGGLGVFPPLKRAMKEN